jgi:hypothetical protein
MPSESPGNPQPQPHRPGWRQWLQWIAAALVLLALSEVLWVWQTWPVRVLLHAPGHAKDGRP